MSIFDIFRTKSEGIPYPQLSGSVISELTAGWYGGETASVSDTQAGYILSGYHANPWLYSVVHGLAQAAAAVPYYFASDKDGQEFRIEGPELRRIAELKSLLERPNVNQTGAEFFEQLYATTLLSPTTYILKYRGQSGSVEQLFVIPENLVSVMWANSTLKIPRSYAVSIPGVSRDIMQVATEDLIAIRNPELSLTHESGAASPVRAARVVLEKSQTALKSSVTMLGNMGAMGMAVLTDPDATPEDAASVEKAYQHKYAGQRKIGKIVFTNGDMKYFPIGHTVRDMDFSDSDTQAIRAFCGLYNAPSQLFGDVAGSTYSNYREARRALYTNAVLPLVKRIHEVFAWRLYPDFPGLSDIYTTPDTGRIPEMQDDLEKQAAAVDKLIRAGVITPAEGRAMIGLQPLENVMAEELYQQGLSPLTAIDDGLEG